jgi:menaquinone-dependent protoporphyrinogen oxidase
MACEADILIMSKILIVYSTTDGHTLKICSELQGQLQQLGHDVELIDVAAVEEAGLATAEKIVIGASIRYGKHSKLVYRLIQRHGKLLESKPNAFFSVNLVARKPGKDTPHGNPYLRKFLSQISWQPANLAVFAGKIEYPRYNFLDRSMIRAIMWMTKGPTDPKTTVEFTDWEKVQEFGQIIDRM